MKKVLISAGLATMAGVAGLVPQAARAAAATPIAIDGLVTTAAGAPYPGAVVVAWCGGLSHFGGSSTADAAGHYAIHTNSDDCPLGSQLTVTTDIDYDLASDGAAHAPVHSTTTVSIKLGDYTTVAVPEYGWTSGVLAVGVGASGIALVRRRFVGGR